MSGLNLPPVLVESVRKQNAVLFMGAGASRGARHPNGNKIPLGNDLRDLICDKFLGGDLKDRNLAEVADYAASEAGLPGLQDYIKQIYQEYEPADFHLLLPTFRWLALATTNYDLIVEKAYHSVKERRQELVKFYKNGQVVDAELKRHVDGLQFLKLHGCIDCISDRDVPLILASDQYVRYKENRNRLYSRLEGFGYEHPIIFCGYKIGDLHIKEILFDLADDKIFRPQYYYISPDVSDYEIRYWAQHRVTVLKGTFEQFLKELDKKISSFDRQLPILREGGSKTSLHSKFRIKDAIESDELKEFLTLDVDHVRKDMPIDKQDPKEFYKGYDTGWGCISQNLDARRTLCDTILVDTILPDENEKTRSVDLFLIKGPAGSGKTIILKRVAWEASHEYDKIVLFLKESGAIRFDAIEQIFNLTGQRVYLFIDRIAQSFDEVDLLINYCERKNIKLSIIAAERENEWNIRCENLEPQVSKEFPVRSLNDSEAKNLLDLLQTHGALGELAPLTEKERLDALLTRAERQLLVVLHEATLGVPFEKIILDEYHSILPNEAQSLYLDVCTLNRLGIKVRAGLIARTTGIRFEDFEKRFFRPLEHVVKTSFDPYIQDRTYGARHQHIAEMVFDQVLVKPEERYDQLLKIAEGLNTDYSSDSSAFRQIMKGQNVIDTFISQELGRAFYDSLERMHGKSPHLLQQKAIFEMRHHGGDIYHAERYIDEALSLAPHDSSIKHTKVMVSRQMALKTDNDLVRDKYRKQAKSILSEINDYRGGNPYGHYAKALIAFDELKEIVKKHEESGTEDKLVERQIATVTNTVQSILGDALQQFPDKSELLTLESQFRDFLSQHGKAIDALRKAFANNKRQDWLAIRLARRLIEAGASSEAKTVLKECLDANPSSKAAHFELSQIYMSSGSEGERRLILDHLRKSFTEGDHNFEAQFWYARQLFINGQYDNARDLFDKLSKEKFSSEMRNMPRAPITDENGVVQSFNGRICSKEETYFFVTPDNINTNIFSYTGGMNYELSKKFEYNAKIKFNLAFRMQGPIAINPQLVSDTKDNKKAA